ncbi:MAG: hypothetical protein RL087_984 [Pseudomonadota bacterium]
MTGCLRFGALRLCLATCAVLGLAACEKAQVSEAGKRKPDTAAYEGTDNAFADKGWKRGDAKAWEEQLRNRTQGQNEYSRASTP